METKQTMRKPVEEKCAKEKYVSCIRINGVPILPPLITPEKCAAIKYYRKQAVKLERQIQERKKALLIRQQQIYVLPSQKVHTVENPDHTETILDCCRNIENYLSTTFDIDSTRAEPAPKLTCDIQASQYLNNELVLFDGKQEGCSRKVVIDEYQTCGFDNRDGLNQSHLNNEHFDNMLSKEGFRMRSRKNDDGIKSLHFSHNNNSLSLSDDLTKSRFEEGLQEMRMQNKNNSSNLSDGLMKSGFEDGLQKPQVENENNSSSFRDSLQKSRFEERLQKHDNSSSMTEGLQKSRFEDGLQRNKDNSSSFRKGSPKYGFEEGLQKNKDNSSSFREGSPKCEFEEQLQKNKDNTSLSEGLQESRFEEGLQKLPVDANATFEESFDNTFINLSENCNSKMLESRGINDLTQETTFSESNVNSCDDANKYVLPQVNKCQIYNRQVNQSKINEVKNRPIVIGNARNQRLNQSPNQTRKINFNKSKQTKNNVEGNISRNRIEEISVEKPQLIRSNSYILETPSPVLLEHLKKNKGVNAIQRSWSSSDNIYADKNCFKTTECRNRTGFDLNATECRGKNDFDLNSTECGGGDKNDSDLKATECQEKKLDLNSTLDEGSVFNFDTSCTETELKHISDNESDSCISDGDEKLREFIDNNVPKNTENQNETTLNSKNINGDKSESLKEILKKIPEEYSKKILEYLQKYQDTEDYGQPQNFSTPNSEVLNNTHNRTVYYSIDDDSKIGDYLNEASKQLDLSKELSSKEYCSMVVYDTNDKVVKSNKCNKKEMKQKIVDQEYERYQRAASKIGAAAKGYLTRRLLNTEKVQNLIEVIKEALVCAMQLHSENVENIDETDVELHRRLIQQVSAACYAFHDVFFNTPIEEQMSIIAMDRQKKLRPPSIVSTRSTPRQSTRALLSSRSAPAF